MVRPVAVSANSDLINAIIMRYLIVLFIFIVTGLNLMAQTANEPDEGSVSFITSQSIYVKFKSTENISIGDTLFIRQGENLIPALVVNNLSSMSVVCAPLSSQPFNVSDKITVKQKPKPATVPVKVPDKTGSEPTGKSDTNKKVETGKKVESGNKTGKGYEPGLPAEKTVGKEIEVKQDISGRLSISSYTNFSNTPGGNSQRMRYTFSMNAKNIANTKLSAETYISFVHKDGEWYKIQDNIFNGLKIYNLSVNYEFNKYLKVLIGRKINPRISNMGAIDGLQLEARLKSLTAGLLAGSRPDYDDYSFNFNLFQYGAYLGHDLVTRKGSMQSTLAYVEQKNNGKTDRRFTYFQHSNNLAKNLNFFGTIEFDLYKYDTVTETLKHTFNLSNLYLSLRYRIIKQLSVSASYSSRQNIIYFETYKSYIDQVIDNESLQGFGIQANYNPIRYLSIGIKAGYRDRKSDPKPSKNLYGYVTYSRIPKLNISATLSATFLETSYISGKIYGASVSRDLIRGKLYCGLGYRYVHYSYINAELTQPQNMAELNLNWNIYKKLCFSANYEGTFEKDNHFNRIYINLTQRF
jgi:hypothetical protein